MQRLLSSHRCLRELPPPGRRRPHPAQASPAAEPRGGAGAGPALPPLPLPAPGGGAGQPEGPAEGQRPGGDAAVGSQRRPRGSLEGGPHHPAPKPQRVPGEGLFLSSLRQQWLLTGYKTVSIQYWWLYVTHISKHDHQQDFLVVIVLLNACQMTHRLKQFWWWSNSPRKEAALLSVGSVQHWKKWKFLS